MGTRLFGTIRRFFEGAWAARNLGERALLGTGKLEGTASAASAALAASDALVGVMPEPAALVLDPQLVEAGAKLPLNKVYLAPMEGVCDPPMRQVITRYGQYDECFSEFIRVTAEPCPHKTLLREVPELEHDGKTDSGCLCRVQLLGDHPQALALTAQRAVELGARSIDLNFGCPSRFVHHGGSLLLKEPELIHEITARVREALDPAIFLSVKFRLGVMSATELSTVVAALAVPGVNEFIIHARTRKDLYKAEGLNWPAITTVLDDAASGCCRGIAVVANGDITDLASSCQCRAVTLCSRQMVGRAAFGTPNLPQVIRGQEPAMSLAAVLDVAWEFGCELQKYGCPEKSVMDRLKQFLGYANKYRFKEVLSPFFYTFCRCQTLVEAQQLLSSKKLELSA